MRIYVNAPSAAGKPNDVEPRGAPRRLMIYALPNGNTIEQTLGCRMAPGLDWHYDIQHVAAQIRLMRPLAPEELLTLVCAEADGLSWPAWCSGRTDGNARIGRFIDEWQRRLGGGDARVTLNGKKAVGPEGGTFRATRRMVDAFRREFEIVERQTDPFIEYSGLDGRVRFYVHPNSNDKILHTALVGDINGLAHAQTLGTKTEATWGQLGGPRVFKAFASALPVLDSSTPPADKADAAPNAAPSSGKPAPNNPLPSKKISTIPPRAANAVGGRAFLGKLAKLARDQREAAIFAEIAAGNVPNFLRTFKQVPIAAGNARGTIEVAPDYLAVGDDDDFVRIPMTPQTAQQLADRFDCILPTRKMVDAIDAVAEVRLTPQPLTEDRESVAAFLLSNEKIESQRKGRQLGLLTIGGKKDIVISPRIYERPDRLVLYGWRKLDGQPIQPLTDVHVNWYVDYSHGVRLVGDEIELDGRRLKIADLLRDKDRSAIASDEGPIDPPRYPLAD